jgi:chemotaxis signal transduction protein
MTFIAVNGEPGSDLPELVARIDYEIAEALRFGQGYNSPVEERVEQENLGRHICILLDGKRLAIPLTGILEAGVLSVVQSLPLLPEWHSGITNIRSEIVSVVNLALFLGCKNVSLPEAQPYLVVHDGEIKIAIIIDKILGTRSLFRSHPDRSAGIPVEIPMESYLTGRAFYLEKDREMDVDIFDLDGFFSSHRLRDFSTIDSIG